MSNIDNDVSLNITYSLHKDFDNSYDLFDNIMEDISYGDFRRTLFKDFVILKKMDHFSSPILPDFIVVEFVKRQIIGLINLPS